MIHGVRRELARLAVGVVTFFLATTCFGQAPGISQGLTWLQQQVAADGSVAGEGSAIATPFQVRAEALHALALRSTPPSSLAAAVAANSEACAANQQMRERVTV